MVRAGLPQGGARLEFKKCANDSFRACVGRGQLRGGLANSARALCGDLFRGTGPALVGSHSAGGATSRRTGGSLAERVAPAHLNASGLAFVGRLMTLRPLLLAWLLGVLGTTPALGAARASVKSSTPARSTHAVRSPGSSKRVKGSPGASTEAAGTRLTRGRRVARRATGLVGVSLAPYRVPDDCSGLVRLAYQAVGVELLSRGSHPGENAASAIYRRARDAGALHHHLPQPGDIVFFRETYDRNHDGLRNDGLTHVGVIEAVEADGTVVFVHRGSRGVGRSRMNLRAPAVHALHGHVLNDFLRRAEGEERARLTGELFAGYASASRL